MVKLIVVLLFIVFRVYWSEESSWRIIRGEESKPNEIPFIVALEYEYEAFCGGSLITMGHVLTAGHCVVIHNPQANKYILLSRKKLIVVAGNIDLNEIVTMESRRSVDQIIPHMFYNPIKVENDIAIIKLEEKYDETEQIKSVQIAGITPTAGEICYIAGWGATAEKARMELILRKANIEIKDLFWCNSSFSYNGEVPSHAVCAGVIDNDDIDATGVTDACQGDSGGPLVCNSLLTGIVSFGTGCGQGRFPGIYTDVSQFRHWINSMVLGMDPFDPANLRESEPSNGHSKLSLFGGLLIISSFVVIL